MVVERILSFKIYNHLFFCDRGLRYVCDLCVRVLIQEETIYYLFRKNIILNKDIFIPTFINFYLSGNINMFVCQNQRDSFDTFLGHYSKGIIENHYFFYLKGTWKYRWGFFKFYSERSISYSFLDFYSKQT